MKSKLETITNDNNQFTTLLAPVYSDFYTFILSYTKNKNQADDITQEALLLAFKSFHTLNDTTKFKTWLFTIGKNEFYKTIQRPLKFTEYPLDKISSKEQVPENIYIQVESIIEAIKEINQLSDEDRLLFLLRELGGLQFNQIAYAIRMDNTTVRTRFKRIREKIKCACK